MLETLIQIFNSVLLLTIVVCIMDWMFGIDKLNPVLIKFINEHLVIDEDLTFSVLTTCIISAVLWVFGLIFNSTLLIVFGLAGTAIAVGFTLIILSIYGLFSGASRIRKFFKKND